MQQSELSNRFQYVVERSEKRVQAINYVLAVLLIVVLGWALYAAWLTSKQEKITSIDLVEGSVKVLGPTSLCPGDTTTIAYTLDIEGVGVIITDDSVEYANRTVKFSQSLREIVDRAGKRRYELPWTIPPHPDMAADGVDQWMPGLHLRHVAIAASNIYVSRYTDPVRFTIPLVIKEGCPLVEVK